MIRKMRYLWYLWQLMAARGLSQTADLVPPLAERGVTLSSQQAFRLSFVIKIRHTFRACVIRPPYPRSRPTAGFVYSLKQPPAMVGARGSQVLGGLFIRVVGHQLAEVVCSPLPDVRHYRLESLIVWC